MVFCGPAPWPPESSPPARSGHSKPWPRGRPIEPLAAGNAGYGPLKRAGHDLELPDGFWYVRFGAAGDKMSNGKPTPNFHDGMAAFPGPGGTIRLVRNHEVDGQKGAFANNPYDRVAGGGTTNLVFDPEAARLVASYPSLAGTVRNCAGGVTPWGSWITCEETTVGLDHGYRMPHGYCFEVPAGATGPVKALPLKAMGRFIHEAVCIDPGSGFVYETEDRAAAGFYRFLPKTKQVLAAGGACRCWRSREVEGRPAPFTAPRGVACGFVGRHPRSRPSQCRPQPVGGLRAGAVARRSDLRPARRLLLAQQRPLERSLDRLHRRR